MAATRSVVHSDTAIMSGAPVFRRTRVPVDALFNYLAAGDPLERFPSVTSEQASEATGLARETRREAIGANTSR